MYQISNSIEVSFENFSGKDLCFYYALGEDLFMVLNMDFEYNVYNVGNGETVFKGQFPDAFKESRNIPRYINWFDFINNNTVVYTSLKDNTIKFFSLETKLIIRQIPLGFALSTEFFNVHFCRVMEDGTVIAGYKSATEEMRIYCIDKLNNVTTLGSIEIRFGAFKVEQHSKILLFYCQNMGTDRIIINFVCKRKLGKVRIPVNQDAIVVKASLAYDKFIYLYYNHMKENHSGIIYVNIGWETLAQGGDIDQKHIKIQQEKLFCSSSESPIHENSKTSHGTQIASKVESSGTKLILPESIILSSSNTMLVHTLGSMVCYIVDGESDVLKFKFLSAIPIDVNSNSDFFSVVRGEGMVGLTPVTNKNSILLRRVTLTPKNIFYFWLMDQAGLTKMFNHTDINDFIHTFK